MFQIMKNEELVLKGKKKEEFDEGYSTSYRIDRTYFYIF